MNLTLETEQDEIDNPSDGDVEAALRSLREDWKNSFAILASSDEFFIETHPVDSEHFILEYREGSDSEHHQCRNEALLLHEVLAAFLFYRRGDSRFKHSLDWVPGTGNFGRGHLPAFLRGKRRYISDYDAPTKRRIGLLFGVLFALWACCLVYFFALEGA